MYYRKQRRKTNTPQRKPVVNVPLNDVWESYQEPKSYLDFGISEEAYRFLSNRDKCEQIRKNNLFWEEKKLRLNKIEAVCSFLMLIFFVASMISLADNEKFSLVSIIMSGVSVLILIILQIPSHRIKHRIVNSYDEFESDFQRYLSYYQQYEIKKNQFICHNIELEWFKKHVEGAFLNSIVEQLKKIQGRSYRAEEDWRQMTDREFEIEIGKVYSRLGYDTKVTKQSGDGGVDVIAKKDNETVYIQCKHYGKNTHLGAPELQGFWGCCSGNGIKKGIMVCTSSLTKEAQSFASKLKGKLEIVGIKELLELDKTFYQSHLTNSQSSFSIPFKTFIINNRFIDCYHLWLLSEVFYNEEDTKVRMTTLNKWKDYSYVTKDIIVNLTNKIRVYVVLLVPDYLLKEVQEFRLPDYNRSVVIY